MCSSSIVFSVIALFTNPTRSYESKGSVIDVTIQFVFPHVD